MFLELFYGSNHLRNLFIQITFSLDRRIDCEVDVRRMASVRTAIRVLYRPDGSFRSPHPNVRREPAKVRIAVVKRALDPVKGMYMLLGDARY